MSLRQPSAVIFAPDKVCHDDKEDLELLAYQPSLLHMRLSRAPRKLLQNRELDEGAHPPFLFSPSPLDPHLPT